MQNFKLRFYILFVATLITITSAAQSQDDAVIRKLENAEREAILKEDTVTLSLLMSPRIVVQNPENAIVGFRQIIDRIKGGKISYASFERKIENIAFIDNISVVMGTEVLIPKPTSVNSGKTVTRRFTNVWKKENNVWKLTARQATIISIN
jgi:hypothetical protein